MLRRWLMPVQAEPAKFRWYAHFTFFRQYGLEDAVIITLNTFPAVPAALLRLSIQVHRRAPDRAYAACLGPTGERRDGACPAARSRGVVVDRIGLMVVFNNVLRMATMGTRYEHRLRLAAIVWTLIAIVLFARWGARYAKQAKEFPTPS